MVRNSYCLYLNLSFRECKDIVSFSLSFLLKARNMVVINENGEVIFKKLNDIGTLSENTINTALLNIRNVLTNL